MSVAVVTGAGGNLGPVWIEALLSSGYRVLCIEKPGVNPNEALSRVLDRVDSQEFIRVEADVRKRDEIVEACSLCKKKLGIPAVLVNNAGIDMPPGAGKTRKLEDVPVSDFVSVMEVNTYGAFQCSQVFGREMIRNGGGSIVNIGSLYATVSPDERVYEHMDCNPPFIKPPAYGASKAALYNLTRYLAAHWGKHGVRVNMLSPGGVEGGQDAEFKRKFCDRVPLGRMASGQDLSGPLLFLASDASRYVTGMNLQVDGGFTVW